MLDQSPSGSGSTELPMAAATSRQAVELGPAARAGGQVRLHLGALLAVDGVERVGAQELAGLVVRSSRVHPPDAGVGQDGTHAAHAVADAALDRALRAGPAAGPPRGTCARRSRPARWPAAPRRAARPWRRATWSATARSHTSCCMSYGASAVRMASLASRARRELVERTASTARPCAWARRKERKEPRAGSKRSGWFHRRRKTSWVTSSASAGFCRTRLARPNTAPPWRR